MVRVVSSISRGQPGRNSPWFWPGLIGVLVFALIAYLVPVPDDSLGFIWLLCVGSTSWVPAFVVRAMLEPRD